MVGKNFVLCQDYPTKDNHYAMSYVHSRVRSYKYLKCVVVSFSAEFCYEIDGVEVITAEFFKKNYLDFLNEHDRVLSHAPNIKNHLPILNRVNKAKVVIFLHGHEVLKINNYYPEDYSWVKKGFLGRPFFQNTYDTLKLFLLGRCFNKLMRRNRLKLIFVSTWMKNEFLNNVNINFDLNESNSAIINNASAPEFINKTYNYDCEKAYDAISIRPFDSPKYAVDQIVKLAHENPTLNFILYGKGKYFDYNIKPKNLTVSEDFLRPEEITDALDKAKIAIMPTRLDAQGVMMCEMATYGIPLVTSDLPICREVLFEFDNVTYWDGEEDLDLLKVLRDTKSHNNPNKEKFSSDFLLRKEENFINEVSND
ncbi:hypothetical protein C1E23_01360 [Pseudoalteromonas phenolica]|uniref:Glycosyl transferase family 1 domain-containing protein n=1 Tax=Pseudoalteromonas phenolica TaxID=161398 RepID=A0A4Q7ISB7_9GAMM|nr:glycosyltransferase [Pseudoalteromonas phenolica]RZQ54960.1 hypothetical protein C1E23_01360 [Pseudoalteromonas phenolica]